MPPLCSSVSLAESIQDELLRAVAKLSPMKIIDDWGLYILCALTWYQQPEACARVRDKRLAFHQDLAMQVAMRKVPQEDVEQFRSRNPALEAFGTHTGREQCIYGNYTVCMFIQENVCTYALICTHVCV